MIITIEVGDTVKVTDVKCSGDNPSQVARKVLEALQKRASTTEVLVASAVTPPSEELVRLKGESLKKDLDLRDLNTKHNALLTKHSQLTAELFDCRADYSEAVRDRDAAVIRAEVLRNTTNNLHRRIQRQEGDARRVVTHDGCRRELERVREGRNTDMAREIARWKDSHDGIRKLYLAAMAEKQCAEAELKRLKERA